MILNTPKRVQMQRQALHGSRFRAFGHRNCGETKFRRAIKWLLTQCDEYERMRISNSDGMERSVVSIRELLNVDSVELLNEDYMTEDELTDDALRDALRI